MNENKQPITTDINENEKGMKHVFSSCDDLKIRRLSVGANQKVQCLICHIEVNVDNMMLVALGRLLSYLENVPEDAIGYEIKNNAFGLSDSAPFSYIEDAAAALLS